MPAKKRANTKSTASLKREIAALRSTLNDVWAALVDIDEANTQVEAVDAVYNACEIMAADWPDDFEITDEFSPKVQEQIALEGQLIKPAEEGEQTEDWGERVMLFRKALATQLGVDANDMERQIGQMRHEDYFQLASGFLWLMGALTAKAPNQLSSRSRPSINCYKGIQEIITKKTRPGGEPDRIRGAEDTRERGKALQDNLRTVSSEVWRGDDEQIPNSQSSWGSCSIPEIKVEKDKESIRLTRWVILTVRRS